jgi:ABC-type transporter Mla subunit MlaD
MRIEDRAWPLPQGSTFELRWGGTISFSNRYLALHRGAGGGAPMPEGADVPTRDVTVPVEFDDLIGTFDAGARRDLKAFIDTAGDALGEVPRPLRATLASAPPALREGKEVLHAVSDDAQRLDALVTSADAVSHAVAGSDPGLRELLSSGARTFAAVAAESDQLRAALAVTSPALRQTRRTLGRADHTLRAVGTLTGRLASGATEARRLARPLRSVLRRIREVAPPATSLLRTGRTAAPDVMDLLARLRVRLPQAASIAGKASHELRCIRPYTPEIVGFTSTWGDIFSNTDGKDHYIRANAEVPLPALTNAQMDTPAEAAKAFPGLRYAFPRPPGYNAGQPWFLPECGAGRDALDPSKDPEAHNVEPRGTR